MVRKIAYLLALLAGLVAIPAVQGWALNFGSGLYGACQYETCGITISSSSSVTVNVVPTGSGACTIQKDVVGVFTDDSSGFTLSVLNNSTNTALLNGAASIAATSATLASPAALTANTWGYRVDGLGSFGAGPTSAQTNVAIPALTFAGIPASNLTAATLANTSVAANPTVNTNVWYGVCASTSVASGTYSTQVTYTAVTN